MREKHKGVLKNCVENIEKNSAVLPSCKVIRKIIESLPSTSAILDSLTK